MIRLELFTSAALCLALAGCSDTRKLDEAVVYQSAHLTLKLVHYHRNLPLHYVGDSYRVMCRSAATQDRPGHEWEDPGWRTLGNLSHDNQGFPAADLAERVRESYSIFGSDILIWSNVVLNATWDACGHIAQWDPSRLPAQLINAVEKPEYCEPVGTGDCRYYDFQGDRRPKYSIESVDDAGRLVFSVQSRSLSATTTVSTGNFGQVWHVDTRPPGPAETHTAIETVQAATAERLDPEAQAIPLIDWFDVELPPQAGPMVVWSSGVVDCGAQNGRSVIEEPPECLELSITNKWNDVLYISLWYEPDRLRWHFAQVQREGQVHAVDRLTSVPRALLRSP